MSDEIISQANESMEKTINSLNIQYASVRTGRASAKNLENINVDYYGVPTPITQVASIKTPEAHLLVVEPWDKGLVSPIEKAIISSDLGITPSTDGASIRLPFPAPTEERRRELVKQCSKYAEDSKIAVRNIRRDANTKIEKARKAGDITEDDERVAKADIQKATDKAIEHIDKVFAVKEAEVMEI